ncbi:MAG: hypothetical protein K6F73_09180 [Lachnospiraceae bacterium]|nr:hypothetical protein [Lachnospiraceae bacterium]
MKKKIIIAIVFAMIMASVSGCAAVQSPQADTATAEPKEPAEKSEESTYVANPWVSIPEEEANTYCNRLFKAPEGSTGVIWSKLTGSEKDSCVNQPLVQMKFMLDGMDFTARAQDGAEEDADISGMYCEWDAEDEALLDNWGWTCTSKRSLTEGDMADLCEWYDVEIGIKYSLSVSAPDLDGFDIVAVAEEMYEPANDPLADMPCNFVEEQSGRNMFEDYEEVISCLTPGQGYAYINLYGYDGDVLAVTDLVFEADNSACSASLYMIAGGAATYVGEVNGNGSAYPLRLADGIIYGGDNHNYVTYFASSEYTGIMIRDYISDDVATEGCGFMGTQRETNDFDHDTEFVGGQEEFDSLLAERELKPVIEFTPVAAPMLK